MSLIDQLEKDSLNGMDMLRLGGQEMLALDAVRHFNWTTRLTVPSQCRSSTSGKPPPSNEGLTRILQINHK